jgi:hypothetical protein
VRAPSRPFHVLLAVAVIATLTAASIALYENRTLYSYDEADYAYAVERGFTANYFDENALPFVSFLRNGWSLVTDPTKRSESSQVVRSSGDITFYRHFHGPLYFYWLMLGQWFGLDREHEMRAMSLVLLGVLAAVLFADLFFLHRNTLAAAMFPIVLTFGSTVNIATAGGMTPHALYVVVSAASLALLSQFMRTRRRAHWNASLIALGLAFLSVEYAALLVVVFVACILLMREEIVPPGGAIPFLTQSIGILSLTVGALWAGGLLKLSLLRNYIFFAYVAIFRNDEYGSLTFLEVWAHHIGNAPTVIAIAFAAFVYGVTRLRHDRSFLPYVLYPALVIVVGLRNRSVASSYISSSLPPLFLLAGIALAELSIERRREAVAVTVTVALAAALSLRPTQIHPEKPHRVEQLSRALVSLVDGLPREDSNLLVPRMHLPVLHYYVKERRLFGYDARYDDPAAIQSMLTGLHINGAIYIGDDAEVFTSTLKRRHTVGLTQSSEIGNTLLAFYRLQPQ